MREPSKVLDISSVLANSPALVKSLGDAAEYVLRWKPPDEHESRAIAASKLSQHLHAAGDAGSPPARC